MPRHHAGIHGSGRLRIESRLLTRLSHQNVIATAGLPGARQQQQPGHDGQGHSSDADTGCTHPFHGVEQGTLRGEPTVILYLSQQRMECNKNSDKNFDLYGWMDQSAPSAGLLESQDGARHRPLQFSAWSA
jgi:hypothetical protein